MATRTSEAVTTRAPAKRTAAMTAAAAVPKTETKPGPAGVHPRATVSELSTPIITDTASAVRPR